MRRIFTQKASVIFVTLMMWMLSALPTSAKTSIVDFFGKWEFTADVEITDAGQAYADKFSGSCEVTIGKSSSPYYLAEMVGLAGAKNAPQTINRIDLTNNFFNVVNPNGSNVPTFESPLFFSSLDGANPYGPKASLSNIQFNFDPEFTSELTLNDFTVVKVTDYSAEFGEILATFKNCKLTQIEKETINITNLSGLWNVTAANTMKDSEFPASFTLNLTANDDSNTAYNAVLSFEGYDAITLEGATFDGVVLEIPYNNVYVSEPEKIALYRHTSKMTQNAGNISFNLVSASSLTMTEGLSIAKETEADTTEIQYYVNGSAVKKVDAFDFARDYKVSVATAYDATGKDITVEPFDMTIVKNSGAYYVTKFMGVDVVALTYGGFPAQVSDNNPNKLIIKVGKNALTSYDYANGICSIVANATGEDGTIELELQEDGTFTMSDFTTAEGIYNDKMTVNAYYMTVTATSESVEPQPEKIEFAGDYIMNIKNSTLKDYPTSSKLTIVYNEAAASYFVTMFMGVDIYAINYGGIPAALSEDGRTLTFNMKGERYLKMTDDENFNYDCLRGITGEVGGTIEMTANNDGTFTISDFAVHNIGFMDNSDVAVGEATGVTAERLVKKPIDFVGQYTVKLGNITNSNYPTEGRMKVVYNETTDKYYVTEFLGFDTNSLNYGGIPAEVSADGRTLMMSLKMGSSFLNCIDQDNYVYGAICGPEGEQVYTLKMTANDDDKTFVLDDFSIYQFSYMTFDYGEKVADVTGVTAEVYVPEAIDFSGVYKVEAIKVNNLVEGVEYPKNFEMTIESLGDGSYKITKFMGYDATYGIQAQATEDGQNLIIKANSNAIFNPASQTVYDILRTSANEEGEIKMTSQDDGTFVIGNFNIASIDYMNDNAITPKAEYKFMSAERIPSAIENVAETSKTQITVANGAIVTDGTTPVKVYTVDGKCVFTGVNANITLPAGIYVVKCGTKTVKVAL